MRRNRAGIHPHSEVTMSDNLITRAGKALYGEQWQSELARALGVDARTVRRWAVDEATPRPGVYVDLLREATERLDDLELLVEELKRHGS